MADDNKTNVHITHQWGGRDFLTVADDVTGAAAAIKNDDDTTEPRAKYEPLSQQDMTSAATARLNGDTGSGSSRFSGRQQSRGRGWKQHFEVYDARKRREERHLHQQRPSSSRSQGHGQGHLSKGHHHDALSTLTAHDIEVENARTRTGKSSPHKSKFLQNGEKPPTTSTTQDARMDQQFCDVTESKLGQLNLSDDVTGPRSSFVGEQRGKQNSDRSGRGRHYSSAGQRSSRGRKGGYGERGGRGGGQRRYNDSQDYRKSTSSKSSSHGARNNSAQSNDVNTSERKSATSHRFSFKKKTEDSTLKS